MPILKKKADVEATEEQVAKWSPDLLIEQLLAAKNAPRGQLVTLSELDVRCCIKRATKVALQETALLDVKAPVIIVGDIHGQFADLLRLLDCGGPPPESSYLFLGDFVDRGLQGLECMSLLLAYKVKFPTNVYLLRGNHECSPISRIYGFYDECKKRFNVKMWKAFCELFNALPLAATVDEKIFCVHAGLSPHLDDLQLINKISRPTEVPEDGLLCDLLWSDPDPDIKGWAENDRGVSYIFGPDVVTQFLHKHDYDLVVRAHQVVEDGYEFFAKRQLVTIFSAPNYCGEFDNAGAMMFVDESLMCSFKILKPQLRAPGKPR